MWRHITEITDSNRKHMYECWVCILLLQSVRMSEEWGVRSEEWGVRSEE